jgi:ankyrin repeat protein
MVHALIQAGADPNQARDNGTTPLLVAYRQGHLEVARTLFEAGVDRISPLLGRIRALADKEGGSNK